MIRLVLISLLAAVVVSTVALVVGPRISAGWGWELVGLCGGLNLAASWLAFVPVACVQRRRPDYLPQAVLGATVIRLLVVAFGTLGAMLAGRWPMMPLSILMVVFYLVLLVVETTLSVRLLHATTVTESRTSTP